MNTDYSRWDLRCLLGLLKKRLTRDELYAHSRNYCIDQIAKTGGHFEDFSEYTVKRLLKHLLHNWSRVSPYVTKVTSPGTEEIKAELQKRVDAYEKVHGTIPLP